MPRRARPPSAEPSRPIPKGLSDLYKEYERHQRRLPPHVLGVIIGLLRRHPKATREVLARRVADSLAIGPSLEDELGPQNAAAFIFALVGTEDLRKGGRHPDATLRAEASVAWSALGAFPFNARNISHKMLWLTEYLPNLFASMPGGQCLPGCANRDALPAPPLLAQWGQCRRLKDLVAHVLAYRHGLRPGTVQRRLEVRPRDLDYRAVSSVMSGDPKQPPRKERPVRS
jgi:hypothetical protein